MRFGTGVAPDDLDAGRRPRDIAVGICDIHRLDDVDELQGEENPIRRDRTPGHRRSSSIPRGRPVKPKGVVKSHRALLHRVWLAAQHDRITRRIGSRF